jgi:hypothetical protein
MKIATGFLMLILTLTSNAFEARPVLLCTTGTLEEVELGKFTFTPEGGGYGGGPLPKRNIAKLEANKKDGECEIKISNPEKPEIRSLFIFKDASPMEGSLSSIGHPQALIPFLPQCKIDPRYQETLGKCQMPTKEDSRDKCYDIPGNSFAIDFKESILSKSGNAIFIIPGGVSILTHDLESKLQPMYFRIWKNQTDWCIGKTDFQLRTSEGCYEKFVGNLELRNSNGEIIGNLQKQDGNIILRQTKQPFSKTAMIIDDTKETINISRDGNETIAILKTSETGVTKDGIAKVLGGNGKFTIEGHSTFMLGQSKTKVSDCNSSKIIDLNSPLKIDSSNTVSK